jgi:RecJ-like exonuclease
MNRRTWIGFAIATFAVVLLVPALAEDAKVETVTLEGKVLCAKCTLHENVLVVEDGEAPAHYYFAKNATAEKFGEVCKSSPTVRVTGTVETKEGKTWIVADTIERLEPQEG